MASEEELFHYVPGSLLGVTFVDAAVESGSMSDVILISDDASESCSSCTVRACWATMNSIDVESLCARGCKLVYLHLD